MGAPLRLAFACDFFRFSPSPRKVENFQTKNLRWLVEILGGTNGLREHAMAPTVVTAPEAVASFREVFGNAERYAQYLDDPELAWARSYDEEEPSACLPLMSLLLEHDAVVGFELPPTLKRFLHRHGKPYLSLCIHPLRFLRDLCFGASTNSAKVASRLALHQVADAEVSRQVQRFKALFTRKHAFGMALPSDIPLLIGQTEKDSVLIDGQRFVRWSDYEDVLADALRDSNEVSFVEHPSRFHSGSDTNFLRSRLGKTVLSVKANGYGVLLTNAGVPLVLTLASSLGVEAQAFGNRTRFLFANPVGKFTVPTIDVPISPMLAHSILRPEALRILFAGNQDGDSANLDDSADNFCFGENYIRSSLEGWSYNELHRDISVLRTRKSVLLSRGWTQERVEALLGGLCGRDAPCSHSEAALHAQASCSSIAIIDPPISTGERRRLAPGPGLQQHLVEGFYDCEPWGVWSSASRAQLTVPVAHLDTARVLAFELTIRVLDELLACAPVLLVASRGRQLACVFFRPLAGNEQTIQFEASVVDDVCDIEFEFSEIRSPASFGHSTDHRPLGFALLGLQISCMPQDETLPLPDFATIYGISLPTAATYGLIGNCDAQRSGRN